MKHENTKALYRYWNELRAGRAAPYRSELDPRAISHLLESTFILEHPRAGAARFRLAGTKLCEQFGMELRGMSALALWHGDCRKRVKELLTEVVETPRIGHVSCTVETRSNQQFEAEFLYLPLRSDLGEMTRIVGCGYYMAPAEAEFSGYEPLHHWIDTINVYEIESDEIGAGGVLSDVPAPASSSVSSLRDAVARLDARRSRGERGARGGKPTLKMIEGGLAVEGERTVLPFGLRSELDRMSGKKRDATERGHLRLVSGAEDAAARAVDRDGAA